MSSLITLPERFKIVQAIQPRTTNAGITCDYVSLKNVHRAWIVVQLTQAVGHATGIDPTQSTVVAGTDAKAFVSTLPIWANEDTATSDTLARESTDAITYNVTNDVKNKIVVFMIDPAKMDVANGFDVLGCTVDDSSQADNLASIEYWLEMRYMEDVPPAVITD